MPNERRYGLSSDEYEEFFQNQRDLQDRPGACAICLVIPFNSSELHIDHDHKTGKVRGLLCRQCNTALGQFHDDAVLIGLARDYLYRTEIQ